MLQTKQLIIIGGPSCAGKTFLINKIQQRYYPHLREQLGLAVPHSWLYVNAKMLPNIREPIIKRLVVHYDFSNPSNTQRNRFNYLRELVSKSSSAIILTLCVPPKTLVRRMTLRLVKEYVSLLQKPKAYKKHTGHRRYFWKKRKMYKDGFSMFALYERWFNDINELSVASHWILDFSKSNIVMAHPYETDRIGIFTGVREVMDS